MSLEREFVPYEQALALKELGFDEPCFRWYDERFRDDLQQDKYNTNKDLFMTDLDCSAPLYQQAFRFFREKYLLFGYEYPNDYQKYGYRIVEMSSDGNKELVYDWGTKDSVEEAELECLKKLIEIVKNK